jgi:hypothetical protein
MFNLRRYKVEPLLTRLLSELDEEEEAAAHLQGSPS